MAILRSRSVEGSYQVNNAAVSAALRDWETRIEAARQAGIAEGLQQAQEQVAEAQAIQQSVDEKIQTIQQEADQRIHQQQERWHTEWGRVLASLHEALDEVSSLEQQAVASSERAIIQLATRMAGHILHKELSEDQDWLLPIIQAAIFQIPDKRLIQIRLHPDDVAHLAEQKQRITQDLQQQVDFELLEDDQLARGSLILESNGTYIDASLGTNWERLQVHMLQQAPDADWSTSAVIGPDDVSFIQELEQQSEQTSQDQEIATESSDEPLADEQTETEDDHAES